MSATQSPAWLPRGLDIPALLLISAALLYMFGPVYKALSSTIWATDEQGHGPIIFAISVWLLFSARHTLAELQSKAAPVAGYAIVVFACLMFVAGVSQDIWIFVMTAQILLLAGITLVFKGWAGLRLIWFPLFFMLFMVPLPEALVASVTAPLKMAVSYVASGLLYNMGYPVGRTGVMLTVGQYQLLVADACAGLNSMFTLEALGMLYMNLMKYTSAARNITLAIVLVPIAFIANICRVMILVLVTYYFGDEAGQGFVHGFAGMVLFMLALVLMLLTDKFLGLFFDNSRGQQQ
ncbi:exosortase B [Roseateles sp.]|uniref:exosortase B n=1 Tax=Roseateles sp. TaxID=1971397 RepID=UPI00286AEF69|nr:exosortase B [Roseateles sp.]